MRLKWRTFCLAICTLVVSIFVFGLQSNNQQSEPLFLWPELRSKIRETGFELSPDRRLIWYSKDYDQGMVIRRLRDDLSFGEIILDTNSRRKERKELEFGKWWMAGNKLLVYLAEGVTTAEEIEHKLSLHQENPKDYPAPSFKLIVLDPFTGEETSLPVTVDYGTPIIPHPDMDKVLIVHEDATILYSFPDAKELARVTVGHGFFLEWCPDKQRFWGLVAYDVDGIRWVTRIVVTDIWKDQRKVLLEREWNNELYSIWLQPIGAGWGIFDIGNLRTDYYDHPFLVEGKEIAILAYKTRADKLVFIYFSPDGIAGERELTEEILPDALKQLGECWLVEMLPNGRELLD